MWEFDVANRIHFKNNSGLQGKPAVVIATIGIALGLAIMIIAVGVVIGFKQEVRNKVIGFGSHIQITSFSNNNTYQMEPISFSPTLIDSIKSVQGVRHTQFFATKPAILKTDSDFEGIVLKGWSADADLEFFKKNLIDGEFPNFADSVVSNEVLVSKNTASGLGIKVGDAILAYFIDNNVRVRKFTVSGIYQTGLEEFDKLFVIGDIRHCQKLNNWNNDEFCGMEILVDNYDKVEDTAYSVFLTTNGKIDPHGTIYYVRSIKEIYPQIFGWLALLDTNVAVILILMLLVSGFNMISGLLILILDKTNFIGILKAMGARNWSIRKVFLIQSSFLILRGLFWGNIVGIGLCLLQMHFHILSLDASIYFVDYVPIILNARDIVLLNVLSAATAMLMLLLPSTVIARIVPARAIKFE
ncbi:MAG: ABC transporter permease [Paludibacteraceae bacterium]|nr:ABC transporter permease [Paludibacteraceae bacterium]